MAGFANEVGSFSAVNKLGRPIQKQPSLTPELPPRRYIEKQMSTDPDKCFSRTSEPACTLNRTSLKTKLKDTSMTPNDTYMCMTPNDTYKAPNGTSFTSNDAYATPIDTVNHSRTNTRIAQDLFSQNPANVIQTPVTLEQLSDLVPDEEGDEDDDAHAADNIYMSLLDIVSVEERNCQSVEVCNN